MGQRQRLHPGRKFGDDLRERAYSRGGRAEAVGFGLVLMVDVARVNEWRGEKCGRLVCDHLSRVARER